MSYNTPLVEQMVANGATASRESNDALYPSVAAGDPAAMHKMIQGNMSLVIDKVDGYICRFPGVAYLRDDLISEGFVGLTTAVNKMAEAGPREKPNATGYMSYWINASIGAVVDKETANGVTDRTVRRHKEQPDAMPHYVPIPEVMTNDIVVDPMSMVDLQDLIDSCCETEQDRIIVAMRAEGHKDKEIAARLDLPITTTYMLRREIYARFLEKSGLKGEV